MVDSDFYRFLMSDTISGGRKRMRRVYDLEALHQCTKCGEFKPLKQFYRAGPEQKGSGRSSQCRKCSLARQKFRRFKDYGITEDWIEQKVKEQNGLCAICKSPERAHDKQSL